MAEATSWHFPCQYIKSAATNNSTLLRCGEEQHFCQHSHSIVNIATSSYLIGSRNVSLGFSPKEDLKFLTMNSSKSKFFSKSNDHLKPSVYKYFTLQSRNSCPTMECLVSYSNYFSFWLKKMSFCLASLSSSHCSSISQFISFFHSQN